MQQSATMPQVLIDAAWPGRSVLRSILLMLGGSMLIALMAQIEIPLLPVPITGQTLAVLLIGALFGSRLGALTVLTYLAYGAVGLPVFAGGGAGAAVLLGPTAGYLAGFVIAAFVTGWLAERGWDRNFWRTAVAMTIGTLIIYLPGVLWLSQFVGWDQVFVLGIIPFLIGDLLKVILAAILLPLGWKIVGHRHS